MNASTSMIRPVRATLARTRLPLPLLRQPVLRASYSTPTPSEASSSSSAPTASASAPRKPKGPKRPISSCPAGTVMTGLSVLKDQPDPVALPDDQYPDWLWTLLPDPKAAAGKGQESGEARIPGDLKSSADFREEKKRLRAANRADIKGANYLKTT